MNQETLSMMVEVIESHECGANYELEKEVCANDKLCKEAYDLWRAAGAITEKADKVFELVVEELEGKILTKKMVEIFQAVYNLTDSIGYHSDKCCDLLNPLFENSPAYHNAVKSRYDRIMENSEQ